MRVTDDDQLQKREQQQGSKKNPTAALHPANPPTGPTGPATFSDGEMAIGGTHCGRLPIHSATLQLQVFTESRARHIDYY